MILKHEDTKRGLIDALNIVYISFAHFQHLCIRYVDFLIVTQYVNEIALAEV